MTGTRARIAAVLALAFLLNVTVMTALTVGGVHPDVLLLVAVAGGLVAGPERGAIVGFAAGLLADFWLPTPLGLSALVYCLVGFGVGSFQTGILRTTWWIPMLVALGASAVGTVGYAIVGAMVGQAQLVQPRLPWIAAVVGVTNALLAPAAVRAVSWSFKPSVTRSYAG